MRTQAELEAESAVQKAEPRQGSGITPELGHGKSLLT